MLWQRFQLSDLVRAAKCDVLFVPGGSYVGNFRPFVTMSQNLLPFEWRELWRYRLSYMTLKLMLLRLIQTRTFQHADGLIFLTKYARNVVNKISKISIDKTRIIPHGIATRFFVVPSKQQDVEKYDNEQPFKLLYVSMISVYKHQWQVVKAVALLRKEGLPVVLDLVGPAEPSSLNQLEMVMEQADSKKEFIRYVGKVPYKKVHEYSLQADIGLFASSCENMPIILLEAMAAGLPIACSNRGPMPEILGSAGVYFNPEEPETIAKVIKTLLLDHEVRNQNAKLAYEKAEQYSWQRCADETLMFLSEVASKWNGNNEI
jgi:glycosyltransferase involved in cell wall biosynthesis